MFLEQVQKLIAQRNIWVVMHILSFSKMDKDQRIKELEKEVKLLREENKELRTIISQLKERLDILEKKELPSFVKEDVSHRHEKTGQKEGHEGFTRYIPERIDFIKKASIKRCPDCEAKLSSVQEIRERYVEDIPEVRTVITKYEIERRYCKHCKKIVEAEVKDALPNARFGLRSMLFIAFLKLGMRMPSKKILELMETTYNLRISDGEIYKILEQLSTVFGPYYKELEKKIRDATVKHIDETGWRIDGINNWLWIFINKEIALYVVKKHRSSKIPIRVLGNQEGKIINSDRHSAYTQLCKVTKCKQQICWAHILRNSKDLAEYCDEAKYVHRRLKSVYKQAVKLEHKATDEDIRKLLHQIDLITARRYRHTKVYKFVRGICRNHRENLFRFANNPEVESTNNSAERGLRHAVVIRKISNGSRSRKGAEITSKLLSVMETLKLQDQNPVTGMMNLLQNSKL